MPEKFPNLEEGTENIVVDELEDKKRLAKVFGGKEDKLSENSKKEKEEWRERVEGKTPSEIEQMKENLNKEVEKLAKEVEEEFSEEE
jgi:hypothetical protein